MVQASTFGPPDKEAIGFHIQCPDGFENKTVSGGVAVSSRNSGLASRQVDECDVGCECINFYL